MALVDELAHSNIPGSRHEKRWQDVDALLDAGIDVVTTVNIQHLESLNDVVQQISGVEQQETIPDEIVRRADQIEIVDISPEALRRRMAHGNIYPPERVDAALTNYFRVGNLSALRELALLWVAERVDEGLQRYRAAHGIEQPWEARERIVVSLPGGPEGETLLRRAVRIAARTTGAELLPSTWSGATGSRASTRPSSGDNAGSRSRWAARGTRWSGTTSPSRCSTSPGRRTPPRSCSARAAADAGRRFSPARASVPG